MIPAAIAGEHFERRMDAGQIVEHEIERQRVDVIFQLLAERIGQAGKPTHIASAGRFFHVIL